VKVITQVTNANTQNLVHKRKSIIRTTSGGRKTFLNLKLAFMLAISHKGGEIIKGKVMIGITEQGHLVDNCHINNKIVPLCRRGNKK